MIDPPRARVRFDNPPVVEVACGAIFRAPQHFSSTHVGAFWASVRDEFPRVQDAAPVPAQVERFGDEPPVAEFEVSNMPPLRRTWLMSTNGRNLIQIQSDRFFYNWKRLATEEKYTSYEVVIGTFHRHLERYLAFWREHGLGSPAWRQFEMTYVNLIGNYGELDQMPPSQVMVDHQRHSAGDRFVPEPDNFTWTTSYPMPDGRSRLNTLAQTGKKTGEPKPLLRLDLTARGLPLDVTADGRKSWFDLAHEWITHGFVDITSSDLQSTIWKRTS